MVTIDAKETVKRSAVFWITVGDAALPGGLPVPEPPGAVDVEAELVLLEELEVDDDVLTTFCANPMLNESLPSLDLVAPNELENYRQTKIDALN